MIPHTFLLLVVHDPRYMWDLDGLGKISRISLGIGKKNLIVLCDLPGSQLQHWLTVLKPVHHPLSKERTIGSSPIVSIFFFEVTV